MNLRILAFPAVLALALIVVGQSTAATAPTGSGACHQRLIDADGDGIPNCQDTDYVRPLDGTGNQFGRTQSMRDRGGLTWRYRLMLCTPLGLWVPNAISLGPLSYGPGDGTGNDGVGPLDGTGYGPGPGYAYGR